MHSLTDHFFVVARQPRSLRFCGWHWLGCMAMVGAVVAAIGVAQPHAGQSAREAVESIGTVRHAPIEEISGIVKSATYENVYWVHNDSGDTARIFAIDAAGNTIFPQWLTEQFHGETVEAGKRPWPGISIANAANVDWEDIALYDGQLFIADMGNNGNARRDLGVYVVNEPNPRATHTMRALKFIPIKYPDQTEFPARQWHFDSEGLFIDAGKLYFLTKHRAPGRIHTPETGCKLYRLDSMETERENVLTLLDSRPDILFCTGADLSPDGRFLAVLSITHLWIFERPETGDKWLTDAASVRRLALPVFRTQQAEAVCWDDAQTVRLLNEQRGMFRVKFADIPIITPRRENNNDNPPGDDF